MMAKRILWCVTIIATGWGIGQAEALKNSLPGVHRSGNGAMSSTVRSCFDLTMLGLFDCQVAKPVVIGHLITAA